MTDEFQKVEASIDIIVKEISFTKLGGIVLKVYLSYMMVTGIKHGKIPIISKDTIKTQGSSKTIEIGLGEKYEVRPNAE